MSLRLCDVAQGELCYAFLEEYSYQLNGGDYNEVYYAQLGKTE